jgi:hypothetical protein
MLPVCLQLNAYRQRNTRHIVPQPAGVAAFCYLAHMIGMLSYQACTDRHALQPRLADVHPAAGRHILAQQVEPTAAS